MFRRAIVRCWPRGCGRRGPGRVGVAGADSAAAGDGAGHERDRAADGASQADGDRVEEAVCRRGHRRVGRPAKAGPAADRPMMRDRAGDAGAAAGALGVTHWSSRLLAAELGVSNVKVADVWRDYGVQPWRRGDVQVLHRPATGGQGPRRRRALPEPARQRGRAVRGREVPDPGPGPHRADPAAAPGTCRRRPPTTTCATAPPRCSPHWRSPPGR